MQRATWRTIDVLVCLSLFVLGVVSLSSEEGVNPVAQAVMLITQLQSSVLTDGQKEEEAYRKYARWCSSSATSHMEETKTLTQEKDQLEAEIEKALSDIDDSANRIEELSKQLSTLDSQLKDAKDVREKEAKAFTETEGQLLQSVDMLGRAIDVLDKAKSKGTAFVQRMATGSGLKGVLLAVGEVIKSAALSSSGIDDVDTLLQSGEKALDEDAAGDDAAQAAPAGAYKVYEPKSGNIVEVMESLREKAETQLSKLRAGERKAMQNYALLKGSLDGRQQQAKKDMDQEKQDKSASEESKAKMSGDLEVCVKGLKEAQSALDETQKVCMQAAADHEATNKARTEELRQLAEAKKVIQQTMSNAAKKTYSFVQVSTVSVLKAGGALGVTGHQVTDLINRLASEQHSQALAQLASRISATLRYTQANEADPFGKVKKLIKDMVARLDREQAAEAKEHAYCQSETKKANERKEELEDETQKLKGKIDQAMSASTELKGQVAQLQKELAQIQNLLKDLTQAREDEHKAFVEAKADLQKGLDGVRTAMRVLRDYYAADDESLLQTDSTETNDAEQPKPPQKFQKSSGAGAAILGLLEIVESDLAKNLAAEETEEAAAVSEFEESSQENRLLMTSMEKDVEYKTREFKGLDKSVTELSGDYQTASQELAAVNEYLSKLDERCVARPEAYAERKARVEKQIQGLQEALDILGGGSADKSSASFLHMRRR